MKTVTSQRPLKILIRYSIKTVTFQYIIIFKGKVAIASDSIKSGQLPTKCFGFGKYGNNTQLLLIAFLTTRLDIFDIFDGHLYQSIHSK